MKVDINCIAEYIGPVEVLKAGSKGRGLFLTIDVKPHTLLFFEPALANASRNGIKESKGSIIGILGADDIYQNSDVIKHVFKNR